VKEFGGSIARSRKQGSSVRVRTSPLLKPEDIDVDGGPILRGERVALRPVEREDVPRLWALLEDLDVTLLGEDGPVRPASRSSYEARFERHLAQRPEDLLEMAIVVDDEVVGQIQLYAIDHFSRRCELGIALGTAYWNKGYGQDAVRTVVNYAFEALNLNRVGLRVLADDERAVNAYLRAGFVEEGRLRQHAFNRGQLRDELIMAILRGDG
jgi:RimJ/RimL family protein N-acetyltransferase